MNTHCTLCKQPFPKRARALTRQRGICARCVDNARSGELISVRRNRTRTPPPRVEVWDYGLSPSERSAVKRAALAYRKVASWRSAASQRGGGTRSGGHKGMVRFETPENVLDELGVSEQRWKLLADAVVELANEQRIEKAETSDQAA